MIDREAIIQACDGDLHRATRLIHLQQERHWLQASRLNRPWPGDELETPQHRINQLEAKVDDLEAELKGRKVVFKPLMPLRAEPHKTPGRGGVLL